jgi:hypothetical protein
MEAGRFVNFLTLPNAFDQKQLSAFFHWIEFAKLTFLSNFLAGFALKGLSTMILLVG